MRCKGTTFSRNSKTFQLFFSINTTFYRFSWHTSKQTCINVAFFANNHVLRKHSRTSLQLHWLLLPSRMQPDSPMTLKSRHQRQFRVLFPHPTKWAKRSLQFRDDCEAPDLQTWFAPLGTYDHCRLTYRIMYCSKKQITKHWYRHSKRCISHHPTLSEASTSCKAGCHKSER